MQRVDHNRSAHHPRSSHRGARSEGASIGEVSEVATAIAATARVEEQAACANRNRCPASTVTVETQGNLTAGHAGGIGDFGAPCGKRSGDCSADKVVRERRYIRAE